MSTFILIAIGVWIAALGIWYFLNTFLRNSDLGKIKARLGGGSKKTEKSKKQGPSLLEPEQDQTAVSAKFIHRFELGERLQKLIEQAGLKWTPAKLVNMMLVGFGMGFGAGWLFLPSKFQPLATKLRRLSKQLFPQG